MTAVGRVMRYRLQGCSEGGGSWGAPVGPGVDNIQYLGGEKAQIWRIFNTLTPKTTVRKLTVEICFTSK